jgi:hypothetical protein
MAGPDVEVIERSSTPIGMADPTEAGRRDRPGSPDEGGNLEGAQCFAENGIACCGGTLLQYKSLSVIFEE